jgi:hypothetical protein
VVGAGDVVAEGGGGVATHEHASGVSHLPGELLRFRSHQLEVLGSQLLGQSQGVPDARHTDRP